MANTAMSNLSLPNFLQKKVHVYIQNTHNTLDRQSELQNFMKNISPKYKIKVSSFIFQGIATQNVICSQIIDEHIEKQIKAKSRLNKESLTRLAIDKIVSKLEIKFTMPQEIIVRQEDDARVASDENGNACMFFIAKGACVVKVKTRNILQVRADGEDDDSLVEARRLYDGDHFGELSLIYNCKRTASVESNNYCTLASLSKPQFTELNNVLDNFVLQFKKNSAMYDDDCKLFLEKEMDKVPYFRQLTMITKNELIYGFERITFEKGHFICKRDSLASNLILIAEGIVEASCAYDRRVKQPFIIEKLGRGAIINSQTFMLNDDEDTDFVCATTVSAHLLPTWRFEAIMAKR